MPGYGWQDSHYTSISSSTAFPASMQGKVGPRPARARGGISHFLIFSLLELGCKYIRSSKEAKVYLYSSFSTCLSWDSSGWSICPHFAEAGLWPMEYEQKWECVSVGPRSWGDSRIVYSPTGTAAILHEFSISWVAISKKNQRQRTQL